jgi:hypothetical protein
MIYFDYDLSRGSFFISNSWKGTLIFFTLAPYSYMTLPLYGYIILASYGYVVLGPLGYMTLPP